MSDRNDPEGLDALFAAARADAPDPGADLLARVQNDALREMPVPGARAAAEGGARAGLLGLFRGLGGWPALSGLAVAGVTGLWIGASPPVALEGAVELVLGTSADASGAYGLDPLGGFDFELSEG